jgi:hypothetical protein
MQNMDLFTPVVPEDGLHQATIKKNAAGVREVLSDWADGFVDRDGKFVEEVQTTYNSSFWELYLFAVLKHLGIKVDFSYDAPDFVALDQPFAIEAAKAPWGRGRRDRDTRCRLPSCRDVLACLAIIPSVS